MCIERAKYFDATAPLSNIDLFHKTNSGVRYPFSMLSKQILKKF